MGLFTDPVTLIDGAAASRTFHFRNQEPNDRSLIGVYIEPAAESDEKSKIIVKHDQKSPVPRHLLQRSTYVHPSGNTDDNEKKLITVNLTVVASDEFSDAEIESELIILLDAIDESGFLSNMRNHMI